MGTVFHQFSTKGTNGVRSDITGFGNKDKVEEENIQGQRCPLFRKEEFFPAESKNKMYLSEYMDLGYEIHRVIIYEN